MSKIKRKVSKIKSKTLKRKKISKSKSIKTRRKNPRKSVPFSNLTAAQALEIIRRKSEKWAKTYDPNTQTILSIKTEYDRRPDGTIKGYYSYGGFTTQKQIRENVIDAARQILIKEESLSRRVNEGKDFNNNLINKWKDQIDQLDKEIEDLELSKQDPRISDSMKKRLDEYILENENKIVDLEKSINDLISKMENW